MLDLSGSLSCLLVSVFGPVCQYTGSDRGAHRAVARVEGVHEQVAGELSAEAAVGHAVLPHAAVELALAPEGLALLSSAARALGRLLAGEVFAVVADGAAA